MPQPTTIVLVRHGQTDWIGHGIAGRQPGVHLNDQGRVQALSLRGRLAGLSIDAIYSTRSIGTRNRRTARRRPRARRANVRRGHRARFRRLDLASVRRTRRGHRMAQVQFLPQLLACGRRRADAGSPAAHRARNERLRAAHPGQAAVIVSHGDVIRAAVAYSWASPWISFSASRSSRLGEPGPPV